MQQLYSDLKARIAEHADPDITRYMLAMGVLNALWPTIDVVRRERDQLALILEQVYSKPVEDAES